MSGGGDICGEGERSLVDISWEDVDCKPERDEEEPVMARFRE